MTRGGRRSAGADAAAGVNAVEGYLLWQAELARAAERARGFADTLPWLTTAQREEVERAYVSDHLGHAEAALRALADRIAELREQYRGVHARLRRRLLAVHTAVLAVLSAVAALLTAFR